MLALPLPTASPVANTPQPLNICRPRRIAPDAAPAYGSNAFGPRPAEFSESFVSNNPQPANVKSRTTAPLCMATPHQSEIPGDTLPVEHICRQQPCANRLRSGEMVFRLLLLLTCVGGFACTQ